MRKGDEVLVMRGNFAKKKAKVISIDIKRTRIILENINRAKKDGTKISVQFSPKNLQIQSLNLEDKKRFKRSIVKEMPSKPPIKQPEERKNVPDKSGNK